MENLDISKLRVSLQREKFKALRGEVTIDTLATMGVPPTPASTMNDILSCEIVSLARAQRLLDGLNHAAQDDLIELAFPVRLLDFATPHALTALAGLDEDRLWLSLNEAIAARAKVGGKTIVDVTNALTAEMTLALGYTTSGAEELQLKLTQD